MMLKLALVLGILRLCWGTHCLKGEYDNYTLLKITPRNKQHVEALSRFREDPDGEVQFFKRSSGVNFTSDVLVSPNKLRMLERFAEKYNMPVEYKHNYGRSMKPIGRSKKASLGGYDFNSYNSYETIQNYIDALVLAKPDLVTVEDAGFSFEARKMRLVKISTNPQANNPIIFIDAGIHAREWVTPAMALYIIHRLTHVAEARTTDLAGVDWYILPVVNPDGYEYSRINMTTRLWRKTRSNTTEPDCFGVDGNRNFGYKWGVSGVSLDPCDIQVYCGPEAFSEPETRVVRDIMLANAKRLKLYVTMHSYGNYLVFPWGYTNEILPDNYKRFVYLGTMVSDAVLRAGGRPLEVLTSGQWYPSAGSSDDYAMGVVKVPYAYTMELTDGFEFTFPRELLRTALPQYYEGFRILVVHIRQEFGKKNKLLRTGDYLN